MGMLPDFLRGCTGFVWSQDTSTWAGEGVTDGWDEPRLLYTQAIPAVPPSAPRILRGPGGRGFMLREAHILRLLGVRVGGG